MAIDQQKDEREIREKHHEIQIEEGTVEDAELEFKRREQEYEEENQAVEQDYQGLQDKKERYAVERE